jgi:MSHA biogenesis protein MshL
MRIAAHDVDAVEFFGSLFKGSRYSVAVHPGVAGVISVELKDVTLQEALATVGDMYGFDVQRKGNVFHVYPAGLRTETIPVNYLMMSRRGLSRTSVSTGGVTANDNNNGNNNNFDNGNNNGNNNNRLLQRGQQQQQQRHPHRDGQQQRLLDRSAGCPADPDRHGDGRAVITSPQAGLVTMRAYPKELKAVREFLDQSGEHLKRQVVLEARILEVSLNEGYEQGWTGAVSPPAGTATRASRGRFPARQPHRLDPQPDLQGPGGGAGFTISDGNFNVAVSLLKTQGT